MNFKHGEKKSLVEAVIPGVGGLGFIIPWEQTG